MPEEPSKSQSVILIVEDEALVRMDAADILGAAGFEVLEASSAHEAIGILERRDDVRVVFTDIDLAGSIDGMQLAETIASRWPPVKLILTSGHVTVEADRLPRGGRFFPKPYRHADIAKAIREMTAH